MRHDQKNITRRDFSYWFPRISAILFVIFAYVLVFRDVLNLINYNPIFFNFFIGTIILAVTIVIWQNEKTAGLIFILSGIAYFLLANNKLLKLSILAMSLWLVFIGLSFLFEYYRLRTERIVIIKSDKKLKPETQQHTFKYHLKLFDLVRRKL